MLARAHHPINPGREELLARLTDPVARLTDHPEIPGSSATLLYHASDDAADDAAGIARIDAIAEHIGAPVLRLDGHHVVSFSFGRHVDYQGFYIEQDARASVITDD